MPMNHLANLSNDIIHLPQLARLYNNYNNLVSICTTNSIAVSCRAGSLPPLSEIPRSSPVIEEDRAPIWRYVMARRPRAQPLSRAATVEQQPGEASLQPRKDR